MEVGADALLAALQAAPLGSEPLLSAVALVDLRSLIAVLPRKRHASLARAILANIRALKAAPEDEQARRAAASIISHCLRDKKAPTPPELAEAALSLVEDIPAIKAPIAKNAVVKVAEVFWEDGRESREKMLPHAAVALLERALASETGGVSSAEDVKRVHALRTGLCGGGEDVVDLSKFPRLRGLLLRCVTSAQCLRIHEGQKLIAHLLASPEIGEDAHKALLGILPIARKSQAVAVGTVYLLAWKVSGVARLEEFSLILQDILKKAVYASQDPLATNLRTVLSAFHTNKKLSGMDAMLHHVYRPVLFRSLTAANPLVRRNAVIILADAFPIHDPEMLNAELEAILNDQCGKLLMLLEDPVPLVRVAALEGSCRVLGLLWDLVPPPIAKKIIHVMTSSLAFDKTSANVRAAVCDGLRFMLANHQTHPILSVALPRLGNMLHDKVERVRICFLNLLNEVKAKRIVTIRYFDVVPLEELLDRLPVDSAATRTKLMQLLVPSFFPLKRKNKTRVEIAESQIRACLEMMRQSQPAALAFYGNVSMYIPPGPLVEFCMRLSAVAMDEDSIPSRGTTVLNSSSNAAREGAGAPKRRQRRTSSQSNGESAGGEDESRRASSDHASVIDKTDILGIVATILQSIAPSLAKPSNSELQSCVVDIFGGSSLKSLLVPQRNSVETRLVCLKIAGSVPACDIAPVVTVWRGQLEEFFERGCSQVCSSKDLAWIRGVLHCGLSWRETEFIASAACSAADTVFSGRPLARTVSKSSKRPRRTKRDSIASSPDALRIGNVRALHALSRSLLEDDEIRQLFEAIADEEGWDEIQGNKEQPLPPGLRTVCAIRRGSISALDSLLEANGKWNEKEYDEALLLLRSSLRLSIAFADVVSDTRCGQVERVSQLQLNILETIQWATGRSVLESAYQLGHGFGDSLVCIVMSAASDAAALGKLPLALGIKYLVEFISNVERSRVLTVASGADCSCLKLSLDALSASYHIKVHGTLLRNQSDLEATPRKEVNASHAAVSDDDTLRLVSAALRALGGIGSTSVDAAGNGVVSRFAELILLFSYFDDRVTEGSGKIAQTVLEALENSVSAVAINPGSSELQSIALLRLLALSIFQLTVKPPRRVPRICGADTARALFEGLESKSVASLRALTQTLAEIVLDAYHDTVVVPGEVFKLCRIVEVACGALTQQQENLPSPPAWIDDIRKSQALLAELKSENDANETGGSSARAPVLEGPTADSRPVPSC